MKVMLTIMPIRIMQIEDTANRTESYMDLFELAVEQSKHVLMNQKKEL